MRFEFAETDPADHSGDFIITAEDEVEVKDMIDHFRLFSDDIRAQVAALDAGVMTKRLTTNTSFGSEYRWFEVNGALECEFSEPYLTLLRCRTGLELSVLPDMELMGPTLIHTFYPNRVWLDQGHICFQCYDGACHWNKLDPATNAERQVVDYMQEMFGNRYREREFKENSNGQYSPNPNYLKRHTPKPAATNENLKRKLFDWWLVNHANPAQQAIIESSISCHDSNRTPFKGFDEYSIHYDDWKSHHSWDTLRLVK